MNNTIFQLTKPKLSRFSQNRGEDSTLHPIQEQVQQHHVLKSTQMIPWISSPIALKCYRLEKSRSIICHYISPKRNPSSLRQISRRSFSETLSVPVADLLPFPTVPHGLSIPVGQWIVTLFDLRPNSILTMSLLFTLGQFVFLMLLWDRSGFLLLSCDRLFLKRSLNRCLNGCQYFLQFGQSHGNQIFPVCLSLLLALHVSNQIFENRSTTPSTGSSSTPPSWRTNP